MSIEAQARQEAERRYFPLDRPTMVSEQCAAMGFEEGAVWAREQDARELSDAVPTSSNGRWIICQGDWVPERIYRLLVELQAEREQSDATLKESAPDLTRPGDMRSDVAYPSGQ